jgi:hypothetical protein
LSADRILAWLGLTIGLLGLIPIFRDSSAQLRLAYCFALLLLLILFAVLYRSGRGPQYSTLSMRKTLVLKASDGSHAELLREQKIRVNFSSMSEIWCRNIVADGSIANLRIDGVALQDVDQEWLGCLLDIRKRFLRTLYRGDEESVLWSYDLINSFPKQKEFIDHDVTPGTQLLELVVELPEQRPCREARLEEKVAGEPSKQLKDPEILRSGTLVRATIRAPKEGRTIRLSWQW